MIYSNTNPPSLPLTLISSPSLSPNL
jgi:hypothetical protein